MSPHLRGRDGDAEATHGWDLTPKRGRDRRGGARFHGVAILPIRTGNRLDREPAINDGTPVPVATVEPAALAR